MPQTTLKFSIPSLKIDLTFIQRLGVIVEAERLERQKEIDAEVKSLEMRLADPNLPDQEKYDLSYARGRLSGDKVGSLTYEFGAPHEEVSFSSAAEIANMLLMPETVNHLSVRVSPYDSRFITIRLRFSNDILGGTAELSSENEASLRAMRSRLTDLFSASRPGYHSLLMSGGSPVINRNLFALAFAVAAWFLLAKYFVLPHLEMKDRWQILALFTPLFGAILWACFSILLKYLYPVYEFSLGVHESARVSYRKYIWTVFGGLLLGVLASIIQSHL